MIVRLYEVGTFPTLQPRTYKQVGIVEASDCRTATDFSWELWGEGGKRSLIVEPVEGSERKIRAFVHSPRVVE